MAIALPLEQLDRAALGQGDEGALGVGTLTELAGLAVALPLALAVQRVHLLDLDLEDGLHGVAYLGLRRVGVDDERVHVAVEEAVGLLADHRLQHDVTGVLHDSSSSPAGSSLADASTSAGASLAEVLGSVSVLNTIQSLTSTS